jgi:class 3 adenylate cyclase/tetratricopeptide (TPR) repeat protein
MKCPQCGFENKPGNFFCTQCRTRLVLRCPQCNSEIEEADRFCGKCGHDLHTPIKPVPSDLSFDQKIAKIQRYLPEGLTEKILSERDKIEGEKKQVTVMFCDMEGFTQLTERLGPEEAYAVMDEIYEILIHKVHDYEGTVNEMTGDGIVALFGAPIALEDAPQRAIRSAMSIHREMVKSSDRIRAERVGLPALKMRIGIHTGPVVVGTLGNDLRVDFKAVGDTVNLASRMEELALPGTTYVTEETFKLTEGFFRFEALGKKEIKGKEEAVDVYQVIAPSTRRTRFDVSAERGLTPFVGRERELELLLDGFERAKEGRGQAFSIVAEAGIGKSRLLYEFRKAVSSEDTAFLEGRCLSYGRGIAYHPVIDILKSNFDLQENDADVQITEKVKRGLQTIGVDAVSTLPYLLELLSVEDSGIDQISVSPESRRDRILEAVKRITLYGSELRPLIIAFEDLHWADKTSEDVLKSLMESIAGAKILLIFTYRPEFVHIWGGKSYHSQVNLNRLSNRESLAMVTHLFGTKHIHTDLEGLILEKTEGVPFFIEEFLKSLRDLKIIEERNNTVHLKQDVQEVAIPATIQDVIMARVDSLPEDAKEVLQRGAVIDREFSYELIKRVTNLPEQDILSRLSLLKDSELLYERGIYPASTYTFKHALTQEVTYNGLISKTRKEIHENIGKAIEQIYSDRLEEFYETLAHHYSETDNLEKAYAYLRLSGEKASRNYSNEEAYTSYMGAIKALRRLPNTEENKESEMEVSLLIHGPMLFLGFPEASLEVLRNGERLSEELGNKKSLAAFYGFIGRFHAYKGDPLGGIEYAEPRYHAARIDLDVELMVPLAVSLCASCQGYGGAFKFETFLPEVISLLESTKREYEYFGSPFNPYAYLCGVYSYGLSLLGDLGEAEIYLDKAFRFASQLNDVINMGFSQHYYACYCIVSGHAEGAVDHCQKAIEYFDEGSYHYMLGLAWANSGRLHQLLGDLETAKKHIETGFNIYVNSPTVLFKSYFPLYSSFVYHDLCDFRKAQVNAEEALNLATRNNERWAEGWARIWLGRIIGKRGVSKKSEAEEYILQGTKILRELQLRPCMAEGYLFLGELYANAGRKEEALNQLSTAKDMVDRMGMSYWPERIQEVLDKL